MDEMTSSTWMIRYECSQCDMSATCVATTASHRAWMDHMDRHPAIGGYRSWRWRVETLPFET